MGKQKNRTDEAIEKRRANCNAAQCRTIRRCAPLRHNFAMQKFVPVWSSMAQDLCFIFHSIVGEQPNASFLPIPEGNVFVGQE